MDFIDVITTYVKPLAINQSAVTVKEIESHENNLVFEISVANDDLGRVIGREGRVANALRTIVYAAAIKEGFRVKLNFVGAE